MDIVLFGIQGSGKGTQAHLLEQAYSYMVFSSGNVLRSIAETGTVLGEQIAYYQHNGLLVPAHIVLDVTHDFVANVPEGKQILFDAVPRDAQQSEGFDVLMKDHGREFRCIYLHVEPEHALARIEQRAKAEGRIDDINIESLRRRMDTFRESTLPIIDIYRKQGKVIDIDAEAPIEAVYQKITQELGL